MRRLAQKLHSPRGETLVEVLAAVLVCSLAVLLLVSYATAAARIDKDTQEGDEAYYAALNAAEAHAGVTAEDSADPEAAPLTGTPAPGTVTVTNKDDPTKTTSLPVLYYGGDGVYSYAAPSPTPGEEGAS